MNVQYEDDILPFPAMNSFYFCSVQLTSLYKQLLPVLLPLVHIGLTGSIYLTVAIALERYTTVCHPFFKVTRF
jgi:hypothetical protein